MSFIAVAMAGIAAFMCAYMAVGGPVSMGRMRGMRLFGARASRWMESLRGVRHKESQRKRASTIASDMPVFLDVLTLGLAAGLSFDASVELYCKRYDTALASELWDSMLLWRMGVKDRAQALEGMAERLHVPSVDRFVASVCQSLAFGTPLSHVLEQQAGVIREEQRALVEEEIERVPVKMLIPLGTLIVPAMLLAILGPLLGPAIGIA